MDYLNNMTVEDMLTLSNLGKIIVINDGKVVDVEPERDSHIKKEM